MPTPEASATLTAVAAFPARQGAAAAAALAALATALSAAAATEKPAAPDRAPGFAPANDLP